MIFRVLILSFLIGGLASCVKSGSGSSTSGNVSFVTLMNMAPYSPSTELYFNNVKQTSSIGAGAYSSNYGQIPGGTYSIQFKKAGGDSVMSELPSSLYDSLGFYTLVLYNSADGLSAKSMKVTDDYSNLSLSQANYRFWNLCPDAGTVDLYINNSVTHNGRSLGDNVNSSFYNSFQPITSGIYTITAKAAGKDSTIATLSGVNLSAANAYTVFLQGSKNNTNNPIGLKVLLATY